MTAQTTPVPCACQTLPSSLDELDMPVGAQAGFAQLTDGDEFVARCQTCGQHWQFSYVGRLDIPTFEKLDPGDARRRMAAWQAAQPEREARAAEQARRWRDQEEAWEAEAAAFATAQASAASPLARLLRVLTALCLGGGTLLALGMMIAGGEPSPRLLGIAVVSFLAAFALAFAHARLVRERIDR